VQRRPEIDRPATAIDQHSDAHDLDSMRRERRQGLTHRSPGGQNVINDQNAGAFREGRAPSELSRGATA
jgi:hypothetical protein